MNTESMEDCTKSKSVINVLGPIASQVLDLKLKSGTVCDASTVLHLLKQCEGLKESADELMSHLLFSVENLQDAHISNDVRVLHSKLSNIASQIEDNTRDLHRGGDITIKDNDEVWSNICELGEQLLSVLGEALLIWNKTRLLKISQTIHKFKGELNHVLQVSTIQNLPSAFSGLVSVGCDLFQLVKNRCTDLSKNHQRDTVQLILLQLRSTLPIFATICTASVHYPLGKNLKSLRDLVKDRILMLLNDLESHVGCGADTYDLEDPGCFLNAVDKILLLLIGDETCLSKVEINMKVCEEAKPHLELILQHSIAVSQSCSPEYSKPIITASEKTLSNYKSLTKILRSPYSDPIDISISRDKLVDSIELVEQKANTALITLIVKTFFDPLSIMKKIMICYKEQGGHDDMNTLISQLDNHMDNIFQVGGFSAACTANVERVEVIRNCLMTLEWLETCFVPELQAPIKDSNHRHLHIAILASHWRETVVILHDILQQILDAPSFCLVTKQEVHKVWTKLKQDLSKDVQIIQSYVNQIVLMASGVIHLHDKTNFLTPQQYQDINAALRELSRSDVLVYQNPDDSSQRQSLLKRVQLLLTILDRLSQSLNEENFSLINSDNVSPLQKQEEYVLPSEETRRILSASQICQIPVDMDTPKPDQNSQGTDNCKVRKLRRSSISLSKIGEIRSKNTSTVGTPKAESTSNNTSIDITKFLSTCSSTRSSLRSSKRNYSLKIKEINLDLVDIPPMTDLEGNQKHISQITSPQLNTSSGDLKDREFSQNQSLQDVSLLINQQDTLVSNDTYHTVTQELTNILEDLTGLATTISSITETAKITAIQKEETTDEECSLQGIKVQNTSFKPYFPELDECLDKKDKTNNEKNIECLVDDSLWHKFDTVFRRQSNESHKLNMTRDNSSVYFNKEVVADLSDTPFDSEKYSKSIPASTTDSLYSLSPSSVEFSTPQRLYDLCIVKKRLENLKKEINSKK